MCRDGSLHGAEVELYYSSRRGVAPSAKEIENFVVSREVHSDPFQSATIAAGHASLLVLQCCPMCAFARGNVGDDERR